MQVCSNVWARYYPRRDNKDIAKIQYRIKKNVFFRTTGQILTKIGPMHLYVKWNPVFKNKEPLNSKTKG